MKINNYISNLKVRIEEWKNKHILFYKQPI